MTTVTCDKCRASFSLGKPKHRWLDKENDVALKYQQCPQCKAEFPEFIQTSVILAKVRKLRGMQNKVQQLSASRRTKTATDVDLFQREVDSLQLDTDLFQLEILLEQEKLKAEHKQGFFMRSCPKCDLPMTQMRAVTHNIGNEDEPIRRARLGCLCGWTGRYPDLRKSKEIVGVE